MDIAAHCEGEAERHRAEPRGESQLVSAIRHRFVKKTELHRQIAQHDREGEVQQSLDHVVDHGWADAAGGRIHGGRIQSRPSLGSLDAAVQARRGSASHHDGARFRPDGRVRGRQIEAEGRTTVARVATVSHTVPTAGE